MLKWLLASSAFTESTGNQDPLYSEEKQTLLWQLGGASRMKKQGLILTTLSKHICHHDLVCKSNGGPSCILYIVCRAKRGILLPGKMPGQLQCLEIYLIHFGSVLSPSKRILYTEMKTQVTESHKSPAQPLQCLGNAGTFWKAVCPFWLSWALTSPCSHSDRQTRCSCTWPSQMMTCAEHMSKMLSLASDSQWCAKVAVVLVWLFPSSV